MRWYQVERMPHQITVRMLLSSKLFVCKNIGRCSSVALTQNGTREHWLIHVYEHRAWHWWQDFVEMARPHGLSRRFDCKRYRAGRQHVQQEPIKQDSCNCHWWPHQKCWLLVWHLESTDDTCTNMSKECFSSINCDLVLFSNQRISTHRSKSQTGILCRYRSRW